MKKSGILLLLLALVIQACLKEDDPNAEQNERKARQDIQINQHLEENNITAEKDEEYGIYFVALEENSGGTAIEQGDVVVVDYKLSKLDGTLIGESGEDSVRVRFDNNASYIPVSFYHGLRHMREGEKYRFYLPSQFGYGEYELANLFSSNSIVVLELETRQVYNNDSEIKIADIAAIERVIAAREEEADTLRPSGIRKVLLEEGAEEGEMVQEEDVVSLYYTGRLLNGEEFDSNTSGSTFSFTLGEESVIPGFEEAVKSMKEGEKAKFYLPSGESYAGSGWFVFPEAVREDLKETPEYRRNVVIPPYSILEFELELTKITR